MHNSRSTSLSPTEDAPLTKEDFQTEQEVRWCPGCGDYAVLASVQKVLPELGIKRENTVFISGIGCSSRFPYYLNTYGFHTIHGRAPTIATGLKLARPDLSVWVVTGDGDGLSIGTNHLLHMMRRNINVTILLFNNRIYGLTKGQYSPTSERGKKTKTTPLGSIDTPFNPIQLALSAGCTFVARGIDVDTKRLQWILSEAAKHEGTSFVEIYQNCNVFNDGAFSEVSQLNMRDENTVTLAPGEPLVYGANSDKGISWTGERFEKVTLENKQDPSYRLPQEISLSEAMALSEFYPPDFPLPIGIFRRQDRPIYENEVQQRIDDAKQQNASLKDLFHSGKTWKI